ncbi:BEL1-like homeodomain protein 9 [Porphyridium purpureum]|uniref:BEL1-like homeodomain protein 9 n=1 Tax=Porphyridium purpureum TaxID=35688 RepID=A0A5J4YJY0_PORPP|nr:BEL1-like homeodomain protein 9 [Porphyridium purpureum]|eukprot:POR7601..scf289_17
MDVVLLRDYTLPADGLILRIRTKDMARRAKRKVPSKSSSPAPEIASDFEPEDEPEHESEQESEQELMYERSEMEAMWESKIEKYDVGPSSSTLLGRGQRRLSQTATDAARGGTPTAACSMAATQNGVTALVVPKPISARSTKLNQQLTDGQEEWDPHEDASSYALAFRMQSAEYAELLGMYESRLVLFEEMAKVEASELANWESLADSEGERVRRGDASGSADDMCAVPGASSQERRVTRNELNEKIVRALEQLDQAASNPAVAVAAWRPNLADTSHEVLRRWIEDHLDHPFPSSVEMQELAEEAEIELKQAKNFFVNYRKRKWRTELRRRDAHFVEHREGAVSATRCVLPVDASAIGSSTADSEQPVSENQSRSRNLDGSNPDTEHTRNAHPP